MKTALEAATERTRIASEEKQEPPRPHSEFPVPSAEAAASRDAGILANAPAASVPAALRDTREQQKKLDTAQAALDGKKSEALEILYAYHAMHRSRVERQKDLSWAEEQLRGLENLAAVPAEDHAAKVFGARREQHMNTDGILRFYLPLASLPIALEAGRKFVAKLRKEVADREATIRAYQNKHDLPNPWEMKPIDEIEQTGIEPCPDASTTE